MSLPLEDLFNDVVSKAQRGAGLTDEALALQAGITIEALRAVKSGEANDAVLNAVAGPLSLDAPSLIAMAHGAWAPAPVQLDGLAQFNTVYHDMTVNAYVVWDPQTRIAAAFDTGADASPMLDFITSHGLHLAFVFLTHTHPDHVLDLAKLCDVASPLVFANEREAPPSANTFNVATQQSWELGSLRIEPRDTYGHSKGGTTYVIHGLARTVAVVGDALFASSMGGGMVSFADALATNRSAIFPLSDDTILCPGHGPLTTVGEEKLHNPFYPEFKTLS